MQRASYLTIALLLAAPLSMVLALSTGSVDLSLAQLGRALVGHGSDVAGMVVRELRLPRALAAFAVGGLLALSGALLQVLLRNPLADPYILGVSGGAAVAALLTILLGLGGAWMVGGAFVGSLLSTFLVFSLSRLHGVWAQNRLLLTGVVVAAGWGALISFILAISPDANLQRMLFWLMGDLSYARYPLFGINLLVRGDLAAAALGENPARLRVGIYLLASLLTATAVTLAGTVGFVGLIIPHALRLVGGSDHRRLLPNTVLLGGSFLVVADTAARTAVAPAQLPVGVLTALLGVPVFLFLLARTRSP